MRNLFRKEHGPKPVLLGREIEFPFRKQYLTQQQLNHHVHIVGASGFGKSVLISHLMKNQIENGHAVLCIDLKGDREKDLQIFTLSNLTTSSSYNPINQGTATQIRDWIMQSFNWSEEYYKNQASSFLLKALTLLCKLRDLDRLAIDFELLLKVCTFPKEIESLVKLLPSSETKVRILGEECFNFLRDYESYKSLQGLRSQIESLVLSDFSETLKAGPGIDFFKTSQNSKINLVFLDTRRYGETAKTIGRLILQDLKAASAKIDSEIPKSIRKHFVCIIDEFADLAQEDFLAFLDRARSSNISVIVAHQELSDLQRVSPEFSMRLTGNTATMFAFLQKNPGSAETIAGMAGTRTVMKKTSQTERHLLWDSPSGRKSVRETEEFKIHPNMIKTLQVGKCVCIQRYPKSKSYLVTVDSN